MNLKDIKEALKRVNWKEVILFLFGIIFLVGAGKMTPQWLEFQNVSRPVYLTISFITLICAVLLIRPAVKLFMFKNVRN